VIKFQKIKGVQILNPFNFFKIAT